MTLTNSGHRLLLVAALLAQVAYSGGTFLANLSFLHRFSSVDFIPVTGYFLVLTIGLTGLVHWCTQLWFTGKMRSQKALTAGAIGGLLSFGVFFLYGRVAAISIPFEWPLVLLSACIFYIYVAHRRYLALERRYFAVLAIDLSRLVIGAVFLISLPAQYNDPDEFLLCIVAAHTPSIACLFLEIFRGECNDTKSKVKSSNNRLSMRRQLVVASEQMNTVLAQVPTLLAPVIVGQSVFVTTRAYELFLVFVVFMAQAFDAYFAGSAKRWISADKWSIVARGWLGTLGVLLVPTLLICFAQILIPWQLSPVSLAIPAQYQSAKGLFWGVMIVALLVSLSAPPRWYLGAAGSGLALLFASVLSSVLSVSALLWGKGAIPEIWIPVGARIIYEITMLVVCSISVFLLKTMSESLSGNER